MYHFLNKMIVVMEHLFRSILLASSVQVNYSSNFFGCIGLQAHSDLA